MKTLSFVSVFFFVYLTIATPYRAFSDSRIVGSYHLPGVVWGLYLSGNYVFMANSDIDEKYRDTLRILDVSDPNNPQLVSSILNLKDIFEVFVNGNFAYVAAGWDGLQVIDISDVYNPKKVGNNGGGAYDLDVYANDVIACLAGKRGGLEIFDVSDPNKPKHLGCFSGPGPQGVFIDGNLVYVVNPNPFTVDPGLWIVDITDPETPNRIAILGIKHAYDVKVSGPYAYVASDNDLKIVNVSDPYHPIIVGSVSGHAEKVCVFGNYAYIAANWEGLKIVDISDPHDPRIVGSIEGIAPTDVQVKGRYAYVSDKDYGLRILDISQNGFYLSVSKDGMGNGTIFSSPSGISCETNCDEIFPAGSNITLTALPDSCSKFSNWSGDCAGRNSTITVTINSAKHCTAIFDKDVPCHIINKCSIFLGQEELNDPVFLNGVDLEIRFAPEIDWHDGAIGTVKYITPRGTYISSETDGSIVLNVGQEFGVGGKLQIVAVAPDGYESEPFEVPFHVAEPPLLDANYYIFSSRYHKYETILSFLFHILNENITNSRIPTTLAIWGGKSVNVGINTYFFTEIGLDGKGNLLLDYRKGLYDSKVSYAGKRVPLVEKRDGRRTYYAKKCSIGLDVKPSLTFSYNRQERNWEYSGEIGLDIEGYCQTPPYYVVVMAGPVPIPFYARVGAGIGVSNELNISNISLDDFSFDLDGLFTLDPYGKLMFGTGASDIAAIEAYGRGGLTVVWGYPDTPHLRDLYCSIKGGVKFVFLIFQYDIKLWDIRWPEAKGQMIALEVPSSEPQPLSRDYISKPDYARFHNEGSPIIRSKEVTGTNAEEELLQENVFPYSDPVIVSRDGNTYIFWIYDNPSRTSHNRTELVYSKWTGSSWTDPKPVADDGTADFNPSASILPDGHVIVVWQNIKNQLADNSTLSDMLPLSEIAYGIYDPNSNSWNTGTITNNSYWDKSPKVASGEDGSALITWISNTGNSFLGTLDSPDALGYALIEGNSLIKEGEIASNLRPILKASLAYDGTKGVLVWSSDEDGDLSTQNDTEIRTIQFNNDTGWQENTLLTDDNTTDLTPDVLLRNGQVYIVWLHGDDLVMTRDLDLSTMETAVTDMLGMGSMSFKALSSLNGLTLFWTDGSPRGSDIYISHWLEDKDTWGAPKQVTDDDSLEHSISGTFIDNDTMKLVYDKVTLSYDQEGISHPVKTDLYLLTYNEKTDILLNNLYPDRYDPPMGEDVEITAEVTNVGDTAEENIPVYFYKGNPSDNNFIGQATITDVLSPQESREVSISWHVDSLPVTIVAVADPNHEITGDADYTNNQMSLVLGSGQNVTKGDVNGDGTITIVDALFVARHAVGLAVSNFNEDAADVNCDGEINIIDALFIARKSVGLLVTDWCGE